ncbi:hypothetical protein EJ06DRAFT_372252 [Trichodelitschia bisporula]|uniref:Uncharacterized protein n=1 Tax=Trichodelitschia bisporula TaxID=703511 RepID=A0A6G1I227_9PEZI|nr:hypothetical protein EJ06DRAFT_372252 [Trichodelitschia bisporula]
MSRSYITNASGTPVIATRTQYTSTLFTMYTNTSIPTLRLCDGIPRVLAPTETPVTLTFPSATALSVEEIFPGPRPTCTLEDANCPAAYAAYDSSTFSYLSSTLFAFFASKKSGTLPNFAFQTLAPPCTRIRSCPTPAPTATCRLTAQRGTLFYWPAPSSNLCGAPAAPSTHHGRPNHAVYSGTTLTSPSALLILRSLGAESATVLPPRPTPANNGMYRPYDPYFAPCGRRVNATMVLAPSALSSLRPTFFPTYMDHAYTRYGSSRAPHSFNIGDLPPGSVGWEAYAAAKGCNTLLSDDVACPKTIEAGYRPLLAVPGAAAGAGIGGDFGGCAVEGVGEVMYVPITGGKVEGPSTTRYEATVTVGPTVSAVLPAQWVRLVRAVETGVA